MKNQSNRYGWSNTAAPHSSTYLLDKVLPVLAEFNVSRLADLGTGNGANLPYFAANQRSVVGIEPDQEGARIAAEANPNCKVHNLGVYDDPSSIQEPSFDAVVSLEVIEHLFDPTALPVFAKKLLGDGGILIISTPFHGYWKNLALSVFGKWDFHHHPEQVGGHVKFWSKKTLCKLLSAQGFKPVRFIGAGRFPLFWKSMIIVAQKCS